MAKQRVVIALSDKNEPSIENGRVKRFYNSDAVMQTVRTRLLLIRQEWFLNLDAGLPWFSEMLGRQNNILTIKSYVLRQILGTDGVAEIKRLDVIIDKATRSFSITFDYVDDYGTTSSGEL
jgi:hypothetical protein